VADRAWDPARLLRSDGLMRATGEHLQAASCCCAPAAPCQQSIKGVLLSRFLERVLEAKEAPCAENYIPNGRGRADKEP
jgi:hypothetical protein